MYPAEAGRWSLIAACVFCTIVFIAFPRLDLAVSALFYAPETGFLLSGPVPKAIQAALNGIARATVLLLAGFLVVSYVRHRYQTWRYGAIFSALLLVLGPGAAVSLVKDTWDRPRPRDVQQFGGSMQFTPALVISSQCERNCSFTSGDAAIGFSLMAPAFFDRRRRRAWVFAGLLGGVLVGVMRIAQGGHFLSDVVFSGWIIVGVALAIEAALRRIGHRLHVAPSCARDSTQGTQQR
jgi:lipid A 4'-phosphatase